MSVSLRPIKQSDRALLGLHGNESVNVAPMIRLNEANKVKNTVVSDNIFGASNHINDIDRDDKLYDDKYTKTGVINLICPVLNPFLAGRKAPVWRKVLRLKEQDIMAIIDAKVIFDLQTQKLLNIKNAGNLVYDSKRFIFGADYLLYLLKNADIKKALDAELIDTYLFPVLTSDEKKDYKTGNLNVGTIYRLDAEELELALTEGIDGWMFGDYAIDLSTSDFDDARREVIYNSIEANNMASGITELEQFPELSILSAIMDKGTEYLSNQIMKFIFVLPYGYRPTIDNRVDALTVQYNNLVMANNELRDILLQQAPTCFTVLNKYREIVRYLRNIFIGEPSLIKSLRLKDYKSISDTITGKEGLMRKRMQGARSDYSGRAVITCQPDMPIDTIGVPIKLLKKIAEPVVVRELKKSGKISESGIKYARMNCSDISKTDKDKDGSAYEKLVWDYFMEKDRYGIPGRQPTLFYLGMQAFKVRPVKGNSIVLSPLVVMPFNADFDGDQMHYNMPQTEESIKEVKERMYFGNNIRYPKNGEITVVTRHEIIYGLWIAHKERNNEKAVHYTREQLNVMKNKVPGNNSLSLSKFVYDCVCSQTINIYDTVEMDKHTVTAGIAALEFALTNGYCNLGFMYNTDDIVNKLKEMNINKNDTLDIILTDVVDENESINLTNWNIIKSKLTSHNINADVIIKCDVMQSNSKLTAMDIRTEVNDVYVRTIAKAIQSNVGVSRENMQLDKVRAAVLKTGVTTDVADVVVNFVKGGFELENIKINAKMLTKKAMELAGTNTNIFLNTINKLVMLGFSVAKIWPPNITTIISSDIQKHIKDKIEDFNKRIIEREELLNVGLEIESEFSTYFNNEWNKLEKYVIKYLNENLGEFNGYLLMKNSGGKGDDNNILQIFGLKGRVQKSDVSAFNSIISNSYAGQLTGLECFVSAYGSRKGIADKVLATAKPGYMSRKLEHTGALIAVTASDCGTREGMKLKLEDIVPFLEDAQISNYGVYPPSNATPADVKEFWNRSETKTQLLAARDFLAKILVGRCVIDRNNNCETREINTISEANLFIDSCWGHINKHGVYEPFGDGIVELRSPVYCKAPCCKRCYGRDIAAGTKYPRIGRPIGFIAAQAIGEPGTQMTMKNFQKGGVVTEANLTSSFDLISDYLELHNFAVSKKNSKGVISYDMISPVSGYVKEQYLGDGTKRIIVTETPNIDDRDNLIRGGKIIVHANTKLKTYVNKGDSFQKVQGYLNMREVLKYRGYDKAASYLTLMLYSIFASQDVNCKHFECVVADMTMGYLTTHAENTDMIYSIQYGKGSSFTAGSLVTRQEYWYGTKDGCKVIWTLLGLKALPKYKADFFESLLMESMDSYIPRAILMNPNDSMTNPITRAAFGLRIGIGSDLEYLEE